MPPVLVTDQVALRNLCSELASEDRYGFDTEFHLERTYHPRLALVQVAWSSGVALIDPLAVDDLAPLAPVLEGPGLAIAHAADQDLGILEAACGAVPSRLFDTQLAARFLGMATPSLARLVEQLLGVDLPKGDRLTDWLHRPLTAEQQSYAAGDVVHLLELHTVTAAALDGLGRLDWALEECQDLLAHRRGAVDPDEAWWKLGDRRLFGGAARGVAQEVAAWRERRAAERNLPRRAILSDLSLKAIATRPPKSLGQLQATRGLDRRHLAHGASDEILAAVRRGQALRPDQLHLPPDTVEQAADAAQVSVAGALVRHIAEGLGFDPTLLATRADLAEVLTGLPSRLDAGWRHQIVGEPLRRLAAGRISVAFEGDGLVIEDRPHR